MAGFTFAREAAIVNMARFMVDGLREDGQPIPEPQTYSAFVELRA